MRPTIWAVTLINHQYQRTTGWWFAKHLDYFLWRLTSDWLGENLRIFSVWGELTNQTTFSEY